MARHATGCSILAALLALASPAGLAGEPPKAHFARLESKYPKPLLEAVNGREFKHLINPAKLKAAPELAFRDLWLRIREAAAKQGFEVTEKEKKPLKMDISTKEYLDTPDQALWRKGYLIRITTKYVAGIPDASGKVTVKAIHEDARQTLAVPLKVVGVKAEEECQDNVGMGPGGQLAGYIEKGTSFTLELKELGARTLGDFARFIPELLNLGLPADTKLVSTKAYSLRVRPGYVVLPGTEPCGISMEAWSDKEGGVPYLYDFSFGYEDVECYGNEAIHAAGEAFMIKVMAGELAGLAMPEGEKWGGSKVRKLMNRPITK